MHKHIMLTHIHSPPPVFPLLFPHSLPRSPAHPLYVRRLILSFLSLTHSHPLTHSLSQKETPIIRSPSPTLAAHTLSHSPIHSQRHPSFTQSFVTHSASLTSGSRSFTRSLNIESFTSPTHYSLSYSTFHPLSPAHFILRGIN